MTNDGNLPKPSDISLRDSVTQLYNSRHLLHQLKVNMARADRDKRSIALILWNVDPLMSYTNEFGQKEGDKLMSEVAHRLSRTLRIYDEAFRSGADEFAVLLCPGDLDMAEEVRRRISESVSKELFGATGPYSKYNFSLDSGVAIYPGEDTSGEAFLYSAQQSLYKTKLIKSRKGQES